MLQRYSKILRGKARPRFFAAKAGLQKQAEKLEAAKKCQLCSNDHKPPAIKVRLSASNDTTFRNAIGLSFGPRGSSKTPTHAAAYIAKAYKRGKRTLIIQGDAAHGLPFILGMLTKLTKPVAIVLAIDPMYSEKAAAIFKRIVDVYALTLRWSDPGCAEHFGAPGYVEAVQHNIAKLANKETIIRIPLLPGHLECDAKSALVWLSKNAPHVRVQIMLSHKPRAVERAPELSRTITITDLHDVVTFAHSLGLDAESITLA